MLFEKILLNESHLHNQRIEIWEFPLTNIPQKADKLLNEEENARANRFHFPHHKRRFLIARVMTRLILAHYLQQDAKDLTFTYNQYGKPTVRNDQHLHFNLSHSNDLALLAVGQKLPLGIDVEFFSLRPYDGIADNLFSPQERLEFATVPLSMKQWAFFHVWTQKEAFIKACGLGLTYPIQQFSVPVAAPSPAILFDPLHKQTWNMWAFMPEKTCSAALCYRPQVTDIAYIYTNADQFM